MESNSSTRSRTDTGEQTRAMRKFHLSSLHEWRSAAHKQGIGTLLDILPTLFDKRRVSELDESEKQRAKNENPTSFCNIHWLARGTGQKSTLPFSSLAIYQTRHSTRRYQNSACFYRERDRCWWKPENIAEKLVEKLLFSELPCTRTEAFECKHSLLFSFSFSRRNKGTSPLSIYDHVCPLDFCRCKRILTIGKHRSNFYEKNIRLLRFFQICSAIRPMFWKWTESRSISN